jgi:nucleoid DNA-binding protein
MSITTIYKKHLALNIFKKLDYIVPVLVIENVIDRVTDHMFSILKDRGVVIIHNFGVLLPHIRPASVRFAPWLNKQLEHPAYWSVKLVPHQRFRDLVVIRRKDHE